MYVMATGLNFQVVLIYTPVDFRQLIPIAMTTDILIIVLHNKYHCTFIVIYILDISH